LRPATSNAYEGPSSTTETVPTVAGQANYIYAMYPIADRGSSIRGHGGKVEQTDPGFQNPLEIFNIHWYAGAANALRAYGEKVREMMDPGLIEIANEGAEYSALEYLEAVGRRSELAIYMRRFHAEYDLLLTLAVPIPAFEAGREVPAGSPTSVGQAGRPSPTPST
jgi:aspartyl-tRNA(Asn)/glutamyl-tRNA(Gln) amidotransferase subunit A